MDRKAVFEPYDMDTALGTNNSGILMFSPYLEDIDTVSSVISGGDSGGSEAPVYNAQDSVLWSNMRAAFRAELGQMYRSLRTATDGQWNYQAIEKRFEDHQGIWPEAIFNEDAFVKYIYPLVNAVTVDEDTGRMIRTDRYLTMLQGSKAEQRKWWLYNRFRYLDSKYHTGNALNNSIDIRLFNDGTLKLKAAIPLYIGVSFGLGSAPELKRTDAGDIAEFVYNSSEHLDGEGAVVTEMETSIWSGNLITDVGDLSVFYPNECNFSKAVLLRRLKIGDLSNGYSNANLRVLDVRNCPLLEYINCANSPNLRTTVNLENSPRLVEAYFDGSAVTGVDLADGCVLEVLHLPSSITTLTLLNLSKLREFQIPSYENISRLMLGNMDMTVVPLIDILNNIQAGSQVNIQGLYLEVANYAAICDFFDLLDKMTGVTRERSLTTGEWVYHDEAKAVVSGEVHTIELSGEQIESLAGRYPYIRLTADFMVTFIEFWNYDGTELLRKDSIQNAGDAHNPPMAWRDADAQYTYTHVGWSLLPNQEADDPRALERVSANRKVYAAFSKTVNTYQIMWKDEDGSILEVDTDVPYGDTPSYDGTIPTKEGAPATGWYPPLATVTGNAVYTATYIPRYTVVFMASEDDGGTVFQRISVQEGDTPVYSGPTPTTTQGDSTEFEFIGWEPALGPITQATTYTAKFQDNRSIVIQFLARTMREYEG